MKIACITFTYPKDGVKAIISRQLVPKEWDHYWILEERHKDMPIPEGVKTIYTKAPRGKHLDSKEFCYEYFGILKRLKDEKYDIIIKLDSDTALYKPDRYIWPVVNCGVDFVYIKNISVKREKKLIAELCNGICYTINPRVVDLFKIKQSLLDPIIDQFKGQEDLIINKFFRVLKFPLTCNIDRTLCDWCTRRRKDKHVIVGHYGYEDNTNMINCVNEILEAQGREPIKLETISPYIEKLTNVYNSDIVSE